MSGRPHKRAEQVLELATAVAQGRQGRVPWKVLERVYGASRWQLRRYAKSHAMTQMLQQSLKCSK